MKTMKGKIANIYVGKKFIDIELEVTPPEVIKIDNGFFIEQQEVSAHALVRLFENENEHSLRAMYHKFKEEADAFLDEFIEVDIFDIRLDTERNKGLPVARVVQNKLNSSAMIYANHGVISASAAKPHIRRGKEGVYAFDFTWIEEAKQASSNMSYVSDDDI